MRIFLSLLPKYQNYTSVLASIIHLRSDAGFFVNPQRISETTQLLMAVLETPIESAKAFTVKLFWLRRFLISSLIIVVLPSLCDYSNPNSRTNRSITAVSFTNICVFIHESFTHSVYHYYQQMRATSDELIDNLFFFIWPGTARHSFFL